ncbi:hypothetical protein MKK88_03410 [Methylobacterium sp. E-005]|uniref:hypothetical protein n=1 Tax=Methylobacterium sp. E-005 TaxID=2836549 RepID=UPI001FB8CC3C|nr:hypothetical protein [Methylobacterium sp. E-005]MCJ2085043.1 hypothetical protein [Methylobacterium sp. E-005]
MGLAYRIEPGVGLLDVLNIYRFPGFPAEKIYCAACQGHHHARGFTALTTKGDRILLGSKCGGDAFGESWASAEKRMKERVDRQYELHRLDRFAPIYKPMQRALNAWVRPVEHLTYRLIGFRTNLGELASRAQEAAIRHSGNLVINKRVRKRRSDDPEWVEVPYAKLHGAALFSGFDRLNVVLAIEGAMNCLTDVAQMIPDTDRLSLQLMKRRRLRMEASFRQLEEVVAIYEAGQEFFTDASFKLLSEWSFIRDQKDYRYTFEDGFLRHVDRDGYNRAGIRQMAPLRELDDQIIELIQEYRRAD